MSVFQDNSIGVDNPQSREEDEELEEQRRRQAELADLLADGIHPFTYDDSTINSSITSAEGIDQNDQESLNMKNLLKYDNSEKTSLLNDVSSNFNNIEQNYKNVNQQEQLKVLYDVRVREVNNLREELSRFKEEKAKEIDVLKKKVTLSEAEIRHLQISLANSESLLVEKSEIINSLKANLVSKEQDIEGLKKIAEEQNLEICTYKSTVNELQLKLADNNPFNTGARKLQSEELQKAHQGQIISLETLFQEQAKKVQILEKEKSCLEEDLKKLMKSKNEIEEENNMTIMALSKKLQNTQQQCKDLFILGEAIKKESDHFKERMHQLERDELGLSDDAFQALKLDKETLIVYMEKLKRMLLDKEIEIDTLNAKLKFYDTDLDELFEYRQVLSNMYSCEIKLCSNSEHEELIVFMQRQLQSYQQAVEDRNNQILNLNMVNKELQEKIEEMIQQTRTEIQNLSQKYSLPQLETMSNELKNAEETINGLKRELLERDEIDKTVKEELNRVVDEKKELLKQMEEFKKAESQLTEEKEKVKTQLQRICLKLGLSEADLSESDLDVHKMSSLKLKYGPVHEQLQQILTHLENSSFKRANFNIIYKLKKDIRVFLETESLENVREKLEQWDNMLSDFIESLRHSDGFLKANLKEMELKDSVEDLTNAKTMLEGEKCNLEYELKSRIKELEDAKKEIVVLKGNENALVKEREENLQTIDNLEEKIVKLKKYSEVLEEGKFEIEKQLESMEKELNEMKEERINLHKKVSEKNEDLMRKSLVKELKNVENVLEQDKENSGILGSDLFQKCLQAQLLKAELVLREHLQEESVKKMQKIEEEYKKVIVEKAEMYHKEKEKWKSQDAIYRKKFAGVLEECGKKIEELEKENMNLLRQLHVVVQECKNYKIAVTQIMEKYNKVVASCKKTVGDLNKQWLGVLEYYVYKVGKVEKQTNKGVKSVMKKIALNQTEINIIESVYQEKIKKIKMREPK